MITFAVVCLLLIFVARAFYGAGKRAAQVQMEDELRRLGYKPGTPLKLCDRTEGHDGPCNGLPRKVCVTDFVAEGFARVLPCGCLDVCTNQRDHDVPAGTRQPHELDTFGNCPECAEMGARSLRERYPADFVEVDENVWDVRKADAQHAHRQRDDEIYGRHG